MPGNTDQDFENGSTTDPVCGMTVDPAVSEHAAEHDGERPAL